MIESLQKIYERNIRGDWPDKGTVHSYIEVYEEILEPYRHTAKNILEIGLMSGESLRMWSEYFAGNVFGVDCDLKPHGGKADLTQIIEDGYDVLIGDASNPEHMKLFFEGRKFDVVIEDANHDVNQQLAIYSTIRPYLNKGSIYIIEDIQDIDNTKAIFNAIGGEIIDRRKIKNRYDDVLVIIKQ